MRPNRRPHRSDEKIAPMSQASQVFGRQPAATPISVAEEAAPRTRGSSMARNAIIVSAAFILSRVLGLGREVILANQFGTGPEMNAYVSAFRIPDLLFMVVMSGAFGAAFIPVFADFVARGDRGRASRLASAILTWSGIGIVALSGVVFLLARPLTDLVVAPGFDAATKDLTVELMRILLLSPIFLGLGIAAKGILEAQNQFTLPAIAPLIYNAAIIAGALYFAPDHGIQAVAWAVIAGAFGHFAVQVPGLIRSGISFRPTLDRTVDGLREVLRLLGPRVVGLAAFQLNFIAVNAFASASDKEHVAAINYAWQLLMLPHGVLALSISTVVFPSLAALYGQGDREGFARMLDRTMRPLLFLSVPASVGLLLVGRPIVTVIFQSGSFDAASTDLVSTPLAWFAVGLVGYGITEILTRVFYATRDTRTPVITGILTIVLNIILCALLVDSLSHGGLALSLSATTAAEAVILMGFLKVRSGQVFAAGFLPWLGKVLLAGAGMGAVILVTVGWLNDVLASDIPLVAQLVYFGVCMAMYVLTFVYLAWALRIPELHQSVTKVMARVPARVRGRMKWLGADGEQPVA
jgi:putative peptidoglycan lipid II flippase